MEPGAVSQVFVGITKGHEATSSPWRYAEGLVLTREGEPILLVPPAGGVRRIGPDPELAQRGKLAAAFRNWAPISCRVILVACEALWTIVENSKDETAREVARGALLTIAGPLQGLPPRRPKPSPESATDGALKA